MRQGIRIVFLTLALLPLAGCLDFDQFLTDGGTSDVFVVPRDTGPVATDVGE
jgi:hypothetical protein